MTAIETPASPTNRVAGTVVSWMVTGAVSLAWLVACAFFVLATPIFALLFTGLGVELPFATRFLMSNYIWFYPLLFGVLAVVIFVKQLRAPDVRRRLKATGIGMLAAIAAAGLIILGMYLPVFTLMYRLAR